MGQRGPDITAQVMQYNIFDVVLHPSLFQAPQRDIRHPGAPTPPDPSTMLPNLHVRTSNAESPACWDDDEWTEIRQRLWNAKRVVSA
ncbi:hypothetical protein GGH12_001609 [Coemansia sp. RSA 1822]|nr:hypothetical protein GGH12_001609 [Coemansia sp. RSA 1822]